MHSNRIPIFYAILAAICYGVSTPVSKFLLQYVPSAFMAALLYIGAGAGMSVVSAFRGRQIRQKEARLAKKELPYVIAMIILDIAAPFLLMTGLSMTTAATASLLSNFEIVATAMIAFFAFKEAVGKRMWLAISLITIASIILSVEDLSSFTFSPGSALILAACACWGIENNCTRMLSLKNPAQIVIIKGIGSGTGSLLIALSTGHYTTSILPIAGALLLGFITYGLSIYFYILAQRHLGAARTSAFYAFAPFIGVGLSLITFREFPAVSFILGLILMIIGTYFTVFENHRHSHVHQEIKHEHRHCHDDGHHNHKHDFPVEGEHNHIHFHEKQVHNHLHMPDIHHSHAH